VGVSFASTAVIWRTQYHHVRLSEHVSPFSPLAGSLGRMSLTAAQSLVQANATILSYLDVYWVFGVLAFCMAPLALIIKTPPKGAAGGH
jgi:DHA2 family multidrug resistance protein